MSMRVQLALNVRDIDEAIEYYSKLFDAKPHKIKEGYANFAIEDPPLKLVLFEHPDAPERLNHLGVETFEQEDVDAAVERFNGAGITEKIQEDTTCCYARSSKVWSLDPQGMRWEWYTIKEDTAEFGADA